MPFINKDDVKKACDLRDYASVNGLFTEKSKKSGNYVGKCPHCAKKRSFVIYADGFYCHACGYSGDCFDYVMAHERCTFSEAVKILL